MNQPPINQPYGSYGAYGPPEPARRPDPFLRFVRTTFLFAVFALIALAVYRFTLAPTASARDGDARPIPVTPRRDLAGDEKNTIDLFERVSPAAVHITNLALRRDRRSFDLLQIPRGQGSGLVWSRDGYIVTNYHVIHGGNAARVALADRSTWRARVVGVAPNLDLAVLKIDAPAERLTPVAIGTSEDLRVGQKVYAIGNPFGLDYSMSKGIISGLHREIKSITGRVIQGVIQTDAAINPGNSGGPLLDSAGRLIGVNTAIASPSGAFAGVGFAVPVDTVNRVVPELIRSGKVTQAGLGIVRDHDQVARRLGYEGVAIRHVNPGSAAERAGLLGPRFDEEGNYLHGDILVELGGKRVRGYSELRDILGNRGVGNRVEVVVIRAGGKKLRLTATLQRVD